MDRHFYCDECGQFFELNTMLVRHKLKQHHKRQKVSVWLQEFVNETVYSSDSNCEYEISTTITRIPKIKSENNQDVAIVNVKSNGIADTNLIQHNDKSMRLDIHTDKFNINEFMEPKDLCEENIRQCNGSLEENNPNKLNCTECLDEFQDQNGILTHMRLKHRATFKQIADMFPSNDENKILCSFCDKLFQNKNEISAHLKRMHRDELALPKLKKKTLKCEPCSTVFTRANLYYAHRKECKQICVKNLKSYLCYICGKNYLSSNHLKIHMRKHTGERPFKCDICGRDFAIKKTWQDHAYTHSGVKPYKCTFEGCDKTFAHASGVRQHKICMHSQEKKYQCDHCQKLFSKKDHLLEHVRTHTGERPHECKLCGTKFKLASTLRIHYRTHTGERPFRCKLCNKGFIKSYGLKQHLRTKRNCVPQKKDTQDDYSIKNVEFK